MEKALLDNLDSAVRRDSYGKGYPDSKAEQIRTLRRRVFLAIEMEKEEAKKAKRYIEKAKKYPPQYFLNFSCKNDKFVLISQ